MKKSMLFLGMLAGCADSLIAGPGLTIVNKSKYPVIAIVTHGNCRVWSDVKAMVIDNVGGAIDNYFDNAIKAVSNEKPTAEPGKDSSFFTPQKRLELQRDTLKNTLVAYSGDGKPCAIRQIPANGGSALIKPTFIPGSETLGLIKGFSLIITDLDGNIVLGKDPNKKSVNLKDVKGSDIQKNKVREIKADSTATIDEAGVLHYIPEASKEWLETTVNH